MLKWYEQVRLEPGNNYISSRIRLVRNWSEYCFPSRLDENASAEMIGRLRDSFDGIGNAAGETMTGCMLKDIPEISRMAMRERRVLNSGIIERKAPVGVILSESEDISLVLNGDDHIRLQLLSPNFHLYDLWAKADRLDDFINERISYAYNDRYGYLTAFPTNVGTGMRANVVVHLPALSLGRQFPNLLESMTRFGVSIRGVYGNGKENYGALYDISNTKTLGMTEREILDLVCKVASQLNNEENQVRKKSLETHRLERVDETFRAYGILKYARKLTIRDALSYLSRVMAGIADGIVTTGDEASFYRFYFGIQPSNLLASCSGPADREQIDRVRADWLRAKLPELKEA